MTVTPAAPEHTAAIVNLLEEMDRFYGTTDFEPLDVRHRQVSEALFTDPPAAYAVLAWDSDDLVGIASYSFLWPAIGLSRSLYLKELYVRAEWQRSGIGTSLMQALFSIAAEHQCSRVEWTTDEGNADAQRFYRDLDLKRLPTKLFYRAEGKDLGRRLR